MVANAGGYGRKIWRRNPLSIVAVELGGGSRNRAEKNPLNGGLWLRSVAEIQPIRFALCSLAWVMIASAAAIRAS